MACDGGGARVEYGPPKTIDNRFIRWIRVGMFNGIFAALSARGGQPDQLMINVTHLKAHRTAASLLKKGLSGVMIPRITISTASLPDVSDAPKAA